MPRFLDDRAPLDMGHGSNKRKIVGCPHCKNGRYVNINWVAGICGVCGKFFSVENSLSEDKCEGFVNQLRLIDKGFTKLKGEIEKKAYEWKDEQLKKRAAGNVRSHEPGGKKRNW